MTLVDGHAGDAVPATDRGLAYGDGVFRTLRTDAGTPLWWDDQYAKLAADCDTLAIACPAESLWLQDLATVALPGVAVAKIIVTRGSGARGYACAAGQSPRRIVASAPLPSHALPEAPVDIRARWCTTRLGQQPRLAGVKHLNRLENVLARAEWDDPAIFEGLLCDSDGHLVSGVTSNVFWMKADVLYTPDLTSCGVAGVARTRILRAAARRNIACRVGRWPADVILDADEVMICNSVMGVRRIAQLDDTVWPAAGWTATWNDVLDENPNA